jgi:hypothetical protein
MIDRLQAAKMLNTAVNYLHQDALKSTKLEVTASVTINFHSNYVAHQNDYVVSGKGR